MGIDALSIAGLLAVPAVLALHWLRRKFPPRVVSALFLFGDVDRTTLEGPRRDRLRTSPSFWIELAAAAIFSTLLLLDRTPVSARHHVFVLDGSAALRAEVGGESTAERIREAVRERVPRGDRVTLIESGSPPAILLGPAAPSAELDSALARYEPWRVRHDVLPAIDLARGLAAPGKVTFLTDREPPALPTSTQDVAVIALGRAAPNVGFVATSRERTGEGDRERIEWTIGGFADPSAPAMTRTLWLRDASGADRVEPREIEIMPGEHKAFSVEIASSDDFVELSLTGDALPCDDTSSLAPPRRATLRIASTLPPEVESELGFTSGRGERLDRLAALLAPASVVEPSLADLSFAVADDPSWRGDRVLLPLASEPGDDAQRRALVGPFLLDRADELTEGLTLEHVIWTVAPTLVVPGAPLASAGNLALWSRDETAGAQVFHLVYDPFRSNLHRAPDWPILLVNLAESTRERLPGISRSNLALGDPLDWRSPWGDVEANVTLEHAQGATREFVVRGSLSILAPSPPGAWKLRAERVDGAARDQARFGVALLDPGTSDLSLASTMERDVATEEAETSAPETAATSWLALLLVMLLLADAWVLRPGVSRAGAGARR